MFSFSESQMNWMGIILCGSLAGIFVSGVLLGFAIGRLTA